ncbi:chemotaxis protein CheW [Arhodomonas sp. AD133]|uniref:chemotaxis protein CheW n=1 Tax=Arhodomonas sp. AD133 TaxID=3415009 RepID=UPI003EBF85D6
MAEADSIRCLIAPLGNQRWLIPGAMVAEVVSYQEPESGGGPDWFAGFARWRGQRLPVVAPELLSGERHEPGARARLLVIKAVTGRLPTDYYALVAGGIPHLHNATESTLAPAGGGGDELTTPVLAAGEEMLLPALDIIETRLAEAVASPA